MAIRKTKLLTLPEGTKVYEVPGMAVRRLHIEFVEGGHGYVYPWIPKREIWVERMFNRQDQCYNATHEIVEQRMMKFRRWPYERAHALANRVELRLRQRKVDMCRMFDLAKGIKGFGRIHTKSASPLSVRRP